jgi:RNA polymerase sigma-70 factor, ECF subfamily
MYTIDILDVFNERVGRDGRTDSQREFEALYLRSNRRAYNLAYRLLGNATEAEDVTQDAYVRAWRHFGQYDRSRPFEGWLFRIVTNLVVDRRRRQKRVPILSLDAPLDTDSDGTALTLDIPDSTSDPQAILLRDLFSEPLQNALDALPPDYRAAVLLADVEDRSYDEIAGIMRCPIGTVRSRIHRARQMLRRNLEETMAAI